MTNVFSIAEILIEHALRAHSDEIAIIAYYGSHAKGTASSISDLDIFYIPDEGKAQSLSSQFILDGLPYDFWPVSWGFLDGIADARSGRPWAVAASLVADARLLYHRSQKDLDRFNGLQARIAELAKPDKRAAMVERSLEEFKNTLFQLGQLRLAVAAGDNAGLYAASWQFANSILNGLALVNQTYFTQGWGANLTQALEMPQKPADLVDRINGILLSQDASRILEQAEELALDVRHILRAAQMSPDLPADARQVFKDFYPFVFEYRNKVLAACELGDALAAGYAAYQLQAEISQLMSQVAMGAFPSDFNLFGETSQSYQAAGFPDLLEPASRGEVVALAERVYQLDEAICVWLDRHGVDLNSLNSEDDLRAFLNRRDPVR